MKGNGTDLLQGTLDLLVLQVLKSGKLHGFAISQRITLASREALNIKEGSLYPALHRLERKGWIKAVWGVSENNRKAKYYELTRSGIKQLEEQVSYWRQFVEAVTLVINALPEGEMQ